MSSATEPTRRQYRVQGVIGRGGFGLVYRARLEGPEGFSKDVAVKLLRDENPPADVLQRFRDEARILGLVRDRAVVAVDPPVRLGGRWAVVMEYVDGSSLSRVLEQEGRIPVGPAVSIVGEIARALDKLWTLPGPEGEPLNLMHRDIKPPNLQITRTGEVKLLDFGIAKARFSARETQTTTSLSGTAGYMAPERMAGEEGATTDIFSLGVVLYQMLIGKRPRLEQLLAEHEHDEGEAAAALALARSMCTIRPDHRPSAREVERECTRIAVTQSPNLREWAEQTIAADGTGEEDPLVGTVLTETLLIQQTGTPPHTTSRWLVGGAASMLTLGAVTGVAVLLLGVGGAAAWLSGTFVEPMEASTPAVLAPVPVEVAPSTPPEPPPEPEPVDVPEPAPALPEPSPTPAPSRAPPPAIEPPPEPTEARAPTKTWTVLFVSRPPDAEVLIDGKPAGITPLRLDLTTGSHRVEMKKGSARHTETIKVGFRQVVRHFWTIEEDRWVSGY